MGVFSKLFGGEDAAVMPSVGGESLSATVTGGFLAAKRAFSGIVQPHAVARTGMGEALWIPLPSIDLEDDDDIAEPEPSHTQDVSIESFPDILLRAEQLDDAVYDSAEHATLSSAPHGVSAPTRRPPPLPGNRAKQRPEVAATTLLMPVADGLIGSDLHSFVESFGIPTDPGPPEPAPVPDTETSLALLVEAAVDALFDGSGHSAEVDAVTEHADDRLAVMETFTGIARVHGRPLRELMFQLSVGSTPRSWAGACRPLLHPLLDGAIQIDCAELAEALRQLDSALERAVDASGAAHGGSPNHDPIDAAASAGIQSAYEQLRLQLPDVFSPSSVADSRRLTLFESLLLQVPALHRRTIAKLYAAGLSTVGQLSHATASELTAVVSGLDHELAVAMIEHLQRFELERSRVDPTNLRSHVLGRMRTSVGRLGQLQVEFERSELEGNQVRKKAVRRAREAAVLELQRLLAEIGDLALIEELKRVSVRGKIRRIQTYLETQIPA